jgi:hypothetical protein
MERNKMTRKPVIMLAAGLLLVVLLSACGSGDQPVPTLDASGESQPAVATPVGESGGAAPTAPALASTEAPVVQPKEELTASDPAAFVRASGNPQLVEFFAFW